MAHQLRLQRRPLHGPKQLDNGYLAIGKKRWTSIGQLSESGEELTMPENQENQPATVPRSARQVAAQESKPVMIALIAIVALIGIANISSLVEWQQEGRAASAMPMRPATANPQQVCSFETSSRCRRAAMPTTASTSRGLPPMQQLQRHRPCLARRLPEPPR